MSPKNLEQGCIFYMLKTFLTLKTLNNVKKQLKTDKMANNANKLKQHHYAKREEQKPI